MNLGTRLRRSASLWAVAAVALAIAAFAPAMASADFGITPGTFAADVFESDGVTPYTQAGGHPATGNTTFELNHTVTPGGFFGDVYAPDADVKNIVVDLPAGFTGDPTAAPRCNSNAKIITSAQQSTQLCPLASQVGQAKAKFPGLFGGGTNEFWEPIYNVAPVDDNVATFAFSVLGVIVNVNAKVRTGDDYGIRMTIPRISESLRLLFSSFTLWGVPASPAHDAMRGAVCQLNTGFPLSCRGGGHVSDAPQVPLLTNPTDCSAPPAVTRIRMESWQSPGEWQTASATAPPLTGCDQLVFEPSISVQPHSQEAGVPSGYEVKLRVPQTDGPDELATPPLREAVVTLPEGVTVSPSAADGLNGCSDAQLAVNTDAAPTCPAASVIGDVVVDTPLLPEKLHGKVHIAKPIPGQLLRIFLVIEGQGVLVKLVGKVDPDPVTGQLTTTFSDNPQLPFSEFHLSFKSGPRAPLVNPKTCGVKTTTTSLTSFAGNVAHPSDSFTIGAGPNGGACDSGAFAPSFSAGTENPVGGDTSSFALTVGRTDAEQELKSIESIQMPKGLLGRIADVPLCEEGMAAAGTCPTGSRIGHIQAAAGAGSSPLWVPLAGKSPTSVSLTGPYRGAPYGLSIVVPAQAGPFDLGKVVVRSALHVDERTTQLTTGVDEARIYGIDGALKTVIQGAMPTILEGIPLKIRDLRVIVDREGFMVNPTNCEEQKIAADVLGVEGARAPVASRFQVGDCAALDFAPRFKARILNKGRKSTKRSFNPRMRFTVRGRDGDANIGRAAVTLPPQVILDQSHIRTTCTRAQFAARNCPDGSIYGHAKAWSPLIRGPLSGPVYLASNGGARPLPDLVADLDGEVRIVLEGWIDTAKGGRIRNIFPAVPDAAVSKFVLTMRGGKRGLLVNSKDLCRDHRRGVANFRGQNGKRSVTRPRIQTAFKGCAKIRKAAVRRQARKG